jgi:hypothetical protein
MKRIVSIALSYIALLGFVAIVFVYLSLSNKQGELNEQMTKLELGLQTGAEKYTRCYYSINNGSYVVNDVSLSHLRYDSTDAEKAQLDKIETDFMNNVKKQCDSVIANYESKHAEYEKRAAEAASAGWITFLIGGRQVDGGQINDLNVIRFKTGDALTYFIFTKEDVEKYFSQRLANG